MTFNDLGISRSHKAERVINGDGIANLTLMLVQRFLQEYRHFNFNIMTACGVAVVRMATLLTKDRRENIIKIFGVIRLAFVLLELAIKLWIVTVLP
ncbi:Uncharacterised protein [Salmonella enterica subsp. arizonae]|uniref:Uncharacterized protein n=1 Tax=Salmonella enterica subsp. arizonae TaxID=59203 RepID=A0A379T020_SALER|nr:Uncharacterised protein [Salmonella enterica subsp. arizonae]